MNRVEQWVVTLPPRVRLVAVEVPAVGVPVVAAVWAIAPFSWSLPAAVAGALLLPLRHLRPELAVAAALPALVGGLGLPVAMVALYRLGRTQPRPRVLWFWAGLTVVAAFGIVAVRERLAWQLLVLTLAFTCASAGAPTLLGLLMATRERLTASMHALERAREEAVAASRDAARAQERARIGREIHDAVGHQATLIAVSAAALASSTQDEQVVRSALQIRDLAKQALAEMRTALGLADREADEVPAATQVEALVEGARAVGLDVTLDVVGTPGTVSPVLGRALYRVVQESLTNAARHAAGAPVRVWLGWGTAHVRVEIRNAVPSAAGTVSGGTGLTGLAERVALLGGCFDAGPDRAPDAAGPCFVVTAEFPLPTAPTNRPLRALHPA